MNTLTESSAPKPPAPRRAVIVGGGLAGMLAAAALHEAVDTITILERDELPADAAPRKGLPQARHAHLLWSGGARAMEDLLPGITDAWIAAGARRIPLPTGLVFLSPQGWFQRWEETHFTIACSRDLMDWAVRVRVRALPKVTVLTRTELLALSGSAQRVTGVRYRTAEGQEDTLPADLVVDAGGRGSRAPDLLARLGIPPVPEREVDSGLVYASRVFRAPAGTEGFPVVYVQANAQEARPGRAATLVPIEGGRWLVTLSGTRGGEPSSANEAFAPFARAVRHPLVGELISHAEPLTDVVVTRSTVNRRRYFEKAERWPEGFVALGDAVASFNPVYGHGMSAAAQGALALRRLVATEGLGRAGLARRVQRALARPVSLAWNLSTGQDIFFPGVVGGSPTLADRVLSGYVARLQKTATGSSRVSKALTDVMTLQAPLTTLVTPGLLWSAARGPLRRPLEGPPLTARERRARREAPRTAHGAG
ncbi:FAD-dependent monooxygenase [Streptomyces sp. NPDC003077]|uniref:FAD-dependent monooxygenase n=1 Tax=Streptomyces sp. NPDC003077 TaxID=3154443 RepID=UPI0033AD1C82